ncbi:MAG: hypothetical protein V4555_19490 [Acidobacteriota bacterium]
MATHELEHLKIEQLKHASADELEHIEGRERENLEGWIPALASEAEIREALEKAFDYRGDITVTRKDGTSVEGYLYDRYTAPTLEKSMVRLIPVPKPGAPTERVSISFADVAALEFSGKDTAAGKRFEDWVKHYWEKKAAGETNIQIVPEKLD